MADLDAIAVTIGPGQLQGLKAGIDFAKALGIKHSLPVIPVNHLEAHCLTPRMWLADQGLIDRIQFPFLSVLVTGAHTEIVLTRGVGLHTVMGITVDLALGNFLDRAAADIMPTFKAAVENKDKVAEFVAWYSAGHSDNPMPADYFEGVLLNPSMHGGQLIEKLARYGDPAGFALPVPQAVDGSANLSYSGLGSALQRLLLQQEKGDRRLS